MQSESASEDPRTRDDAFWEATFPSAIQGQNARILTDLDPAHEESLWGTFIRDKLNDADRDHEWLAGKTGLNVNTLRAQTAGKRRPPIPSELDRIAEALELNRRERARNQALALIYILSRRAVIVQLPIKDRRRWLAVQLRLAEDLFLRSGSVHAMYWLPFISKQLEPFDFVAGHLVIHEEVAASTWIPPKFHLPGNGAGAYTSIDSRFAVTSPLLQNFPCESDGAMERMALAAMSDPNGYQYLLSRARESFDARRVHSDELSLLPNLQIRYTGWQSHPALAYETAGDSHVLAITDAKVAVAEMPSDGTGAVLILDTLCGYQIKYTGLTAIHVAQDQMVNRGDVVGSGGLIGHRVTRYFENGDWISGESQPVVGTYVSCYLPTPGFAFGSADHWYVDPIIFCPISQYARITLNPDQVLTQEFLLREGDRMHEEMTLSDILNVPHESGPLAWAHYAAQPYVLIPQNKGAATLLIGAIVLASVPLWVWRLFHRRRNVF